MKEADIRKYAELMKELGLTGLEITDEDQKVRLERAVTAQAEPVRTVTVEASGTPAPALSTGDYYSVKSDIVGVFYSAPAENAEPYVTVGDRVRRGQTLCVIEAMKLMNEIVAEEDGVVDEICATNKQVVEYGTELFRIRRQA